MSLAPRCPECGAAISGDVRAGFCPLCAYRAALSPLPDPFSSDNDLEPAADPGSDSATSGSARVFGNYELLEEIARGGMGVVYKAIHRPLNRIVALKLCSSGWFAQADALHRFQTEAQATAGLDHPNIVRLFEVGEHEGQHYLSMAFVDGPTLAAALDGQPIAPRAAAALLIVLARAVHFAHQRGVLHRDIKPSNVLLDTEGNPHLADFGLAKFLQKNSSLTQTHAVIGTPTYMSRSRRAATAGKLLPRLTYMGWERCCTRH